MAINEVYALIGALYFLGAVVTMISIGIQRVAWEVEEQVAAILLWPLVLLTIIVRGAMMLFYRFWSST
jgi:hypothetical protein